MLRTRREFLAASIGALAGASAAADAATRRAPSAGDWSALRHSLRGTLVRPGDAGYAQAKLVYDLRFEGASPQAVAYCASASDVQRVLDFCARRQIEPIPRCGGHSYAGYSTGSGVIVDVGPMNGVSIDRGVATVGAGTRLADLYAALAARGVLVPGGSCPTVGISGLALGGGNGVVSRNYGLTADRLQSLQIVTADGSVLEPDASTHSDLYWASRGGGGRNFGVATSFRFRTSPVPPLALFTIDYPWAAAGDLRRRVDGMGPPRARRAVGEPAAALGRLERPARQDDGRVVRQRLLAERRAPAADERGRHAADLDVLRAEQLPEHDAGRGGLRRDHARAVPHRGARERRDAAPLHLHREVGVLLLAAAARGDHRCARGRAARPARAGCRARLRRVRRGDQPRRRRPRRRSCTATRSPSCR